MFDKSIFFDAMTVTGIFWITIVWVLGVRLHAKKWVTHGPVHRNRVSDCTGGCFGGWRSIRLFSVGGEVA